MLSVSLIASMMSFWWTRAGEGRRELVAGRGEAPEGRGGAAGEGARRRKLTLGLMGFCPLYIKLYDLLLESLGRFVKVVSITLCIALIIA